jgi:hypothetical protein
MLKEILSKIAKNHYFKNYSEYYLGDIQIIRDTLGEGGCQSVTKYHHGGKKCHMTNLFW